MLQFLLEEEPGNTTLHRQVEVTGPREIGSILCPSPESPGGEPRSCRGENCIKLSLNLAGRDLGFSPSQEVSSSSLCGIVHKNPSRPQSCLPVLGFFSLWADEPPIPAELSSTICQVRSWCGIRQQQLVSCSARSAVVSGRIVTA